MKIERRFFSLSLSLSFSLFLAISDAIFPSLCLFPAACTRSRSRFPPRARATSQYQSTIRINERSFHTKSSILHRYLFSGLKRKEKKKKEKKKEYVTFDARDISLERSFINRSATPGFRFYLEAFGITNAKLNFRENSIRGSP
ncbi:hypothetical protein PUN28_008436 [Cardiocondyla obscurior]|uniref:Uncharacterized protein n=1 Tax=Cardiocondyla obscurior TaxID=286306 RepID=A0AAW2G0J2_9HYME